MTHDELLARLDKEPFLRWQNVDGKRNDRGPIDAALRAVVELHKPTNPKQIGTGYVGDIDMCSQCKSYYPCLTIQAIEKELG
jgi:hypothetical protein